jgi:hypothetical protein
MIGGGWDKTLVHLGSISIHTNSWSLHGCFILCFYAETKKTVSTAVVLGKEVPQSSGLGTSSWTSAGTARAIPGLCNFVPKTATRRRCPGHSDCESWMNEIGWEFDTYVHILYNLYIYLYIYIQYMIIISMYITLYKIFIHVITYSLCAYYTSISTSN